MPDIYKTEDQEIHHFGCYCAVVWNLKSKIKRFIDHEDGEVYKAEIKVRDGDPYITFVTVRHDDNEDMFYVDDSSPATGGLSVRSAEKMIAEMQLAIDYMKEMEYKV